MFGIGGRLRIPEPIALQRLWRSDFSMSAKLPFRWDRFVLCVSMAGLSPFAMAATAQTGSPASFTLDAPSTSSQATDAATHFTLNALLQVVLEHNTELRSALQGQATADAAVRSASAWANPRLEWGGGRNRARLPDVAQGAVRSWGVSQLLENPSARSARQESAKAAALGSAHQVDLVRSGVMAQTLQHAYGYLLRKAEASAAADDVRLLEAVRDRVQLRVASGEAPRYEIIKADAEIINARRKQQTASLQAEQALLALNRLAAGRLPAHWTLSGSLEEERHLPALENLLLMAQSHNPELRVLHAELDRARSQQKAARASRWPGVDVHLAQSREPETRQSMLGVSLQLPLLDDRSGPMAEADSEWMRVHHRLEGRKAELQQQVLHAWKSLEMARLQVVALSEGAVREAEAALKVAQAAYRFGERGILDVLDAQRVLSTVRADLLQARYQVQAAHVELSLLSGTFEPLRSPTPFPAVRP